MNIDQFRQHLVDGYDSDQLVDLLDISPQCLVDTFPDKVADYYKESYGNPTVDDIEEEDDEYDNQQD